MFQVLLTKSAFFTSRSIAEDNLNGVAAQMGGKGKGGGKEGRGATRTGAGADIASEISEDEPPHFASSSQPEGDEQRSWRKRLESPSAELRVRT